METTSLIWFYSSKEGQSLAAEKKQDIFHLCYSMKLEGGIKPPKHGEKWGEMGGKGDIQ